MLLPSQIGIAVQTFAREHHTPKEPVGLEGVLCLSGGVVKSYPNYPQGVFSATDLAAP